LNFASELVLQAIPGLSPEQVQSLIALRRDRPFEDMNAVQARTGLNPESPAWRYLTVARSAPAVQVVATLNGSGLKRSERRVSRSFNQMNLGTNAVQSTVALARIERNVFPDFLR